MGAGESRPILNATVFPGSGGQDGKRPGEVQQLITSEPALPRLSANGSSSLAPPATAAFGELTVRFEGRLDGLAISILESLRASLPEWMVDNAYVWGELRDFATASLRTQLDCFARGILPQRCPKVDAAGAEATAKAGELKALLTGYRSAQRALWEAWLELVELGVPDSEERLALLRYASEFLFGYAALLCDHVTGVYERELERVVRSGEQRRFQAIRRLLEGDPTLAESQVEVELDRYHIGFVAWGEGGEALCRQLGGLLDRSVLYTAVFNQSWWGWLSGVRPLARGEEQKLRDFEPEPGLGVAFGLEGFGEDGFRATNRQALRARWVARRTRRSVVSYADVAIEALACVNQEDARAFVLSELRGIDDESAKSRQIRETLAAYFAAEHNAASAAAALGIHHQTVANRLRAAEERLARPVGARRAELETALRLRACLDPE